MVEFFLGERLKEKYFHRRGVSSVRYGNPIEPRAGERSRYWENDVTHIGEYKYALDIIIPDPRVNPLPIFAPAGGVIIGLEQSNALWGEGEEFAHKNNYIAIQVGNREFYEIVHIAKDSSSFKTGEKVKKGQKLATTGVNGRMLDPRHSHFMVGRWKNGKLGDFVSLKIRFDSS